MSLFAAGQYADVLLAVKVSVILLGNVTFIAVVSGSADQRINLARSHRSAQCARYKSLARRINRRVLEQKKMLEVPWDRIDRGHLVVQPRLRSARVPTTEFPVPLLLLATQKFNDLKSKNWVRCCTVSNRAPLIHVKFAQTIQVMRR